MKKTVLLSLLSVATVMSSHLTFAAEPTIQQTTHQAPATLPRIVTPGVMFAQQPTQVGDRVAQRVGMELDLLTVIKQADQVANESKTAMRTRQEREIEVLEVSGGQARRAKVSYPLARQMSPENPQPDTETAQVVEGNSYFIVRVGDQLQITDSTGAIPTRKEFEIVLGSMENFGKPNPLAEFLLARQIQVGDKLEIPLAIAASMMGFEKMGDVENFELRLEDVIVVDGKECALFGAKIVTTGSTESPLHVEATGSVAIEISTARTIEATLQGPVSMTAVENGVHYSTAGNLLMAVHSYYRTKPSP